MQGLSQNIQLSPYQVISSCDSTEFKIEEEKEQEVKVFEKQAWF